jgi:hypothetical protein
MRPNSCAQIDGNQILTALAAAPERRDDAWAISARKDFGHNPLSWINKSVENALHVTFMEKYR